MSKDLAPIAVFAYNRAEHIARLLRSITANEEHSSSRIYVFCDGPRTPLDITRVRETRARVRELAPPHAEIIERETNTGLASSIIEGVTHLTRDFGCAIVLEDDLVLSPYALRYFNEALVRYRHVDRVMHVSGYMFPVDARLPETFLYREATCWGWATWQRAWKMFEPDGRKIQEYVAAHHMEYEFDVRGSMGFLRMLDEQIAGRVNSWAIRWYGSMRIANGLALHPGVSLVKNLGFDGTGEHCSETSAFEVHLADRPVTQFTDRIEESDEAVAAMVAYRQKMWGQSRRPIERVRAFLRRVVRRA